MCRFMFVVALSAVILISLSVPVSAQSIWLNQGQENKVIAVEFLKPNFDGEDNTTFATSAIFLSARLPLSKRLVFVGELPFAHVGFEDFDDSQSAVGNPYVGLEIHNPDTPFFAELGLRAPLASNDVDKVGALGVGLITDFDRAEAYIPDVFTVLGRVNYHRTSASNIVFRLRGGPTLWLDTGDAIDETEFFLDYSAQVGYEGALISLIGGVTGRLIISEEDLDLGERTVHQLGAAASLNLGTVRPGVHVRFPLDDNLSQAIDFVYGIHLGVHLR